MLIETQRLKFMVDKLFNQVARGCIDNDWVETFIDDIRTKMKRGERLTPKQEAKVEELFERY